jgi:hypothetical protein
VIFWASVRTENQGGPEVADWPANHSHMARIPSATRFPHSTMLHVLPCPTIPRAVRQQRETRRIPSATKQPQPARSPFVFNFLFVWRWKSSLPPITNPCSHSWRPTPGYHHILFTTVPQFTGQHVRKTHHCVWLIYTPSALCYRTVGHTVQNDHGKGVEAKIPHK